MCLAILVPKGKDKYSEKLIEAIKTASVSNSDGMGYAFKRDSTKKVYLSKGYTKVNDLLDDISSKKLKDQDELIVHLRIGNKGSVNEDMCHPFVASNDKEVILSNNKYVNHPVFIHNGTLHKYSAYNSIYSDTYFFAEKFISHKRIQDILINDYELFNNVFTDHISTSRFIFLFPNSNVNAIKIGKFIEDDGIFYSNDSYKDSSIRNIGGRNYYNHSYYQGYRSRSYYDDFDFNTPDDVISNLKTSSTSYKNIDLPNSKERPYKIDKVTGKKYIYYMGIWVPDKLEGELVDSVRIKPNLINYDTLTYRSKVNNKDLSRNNTYEITNYDYISKDKEKIHVMSAVYGNYKNDLIYITDNELEELFTITRKPLYIDFYQKYIEIISEVTCSKNEIKRIIRLLKKNKNKDRVKYKNFLNVDKDIIELLLYNMYVETYPNTHVVRYLESAF